jgi:hypothetical protein
MHSRSIPLGWVEISSTDPPTRVLARLGSDRPDITSGFGGWNEVARPRRSTITSWVGTPPLKLTLPILLDAWASQASIERHIAQLEHLGRPSSSDGDPPQIKLAASGGAVPYQDRTWVIESMSFSDALMNTSGNRVRQAMTLALVEYVSDVYISPVVRHRAKAKRAQNGKGAATKRIHVAASRHKTSAHSLGLRDVSDGSGDGEDMLSIAARELGDANRWVEIAELNGIRDPRSLTIGQVIRLP